MAANLGSSSDFAQQDCGPTRFSRRDLAADAVTAGRTRTEFDLWLRLNFALPGIRRSDVTLAMNEAMANAAEHAYRGAVDAGTVDVDACYDVVRDALTLTVADRGRWLGTESDQSPDRLRGRGIPLMRALADATSIDLTPGGTRVRLTWNPLQAA